MSDSIPVDYPRLRRLGVDLRSGEGALFAALFGFHFLLLAFQYSAKSVRQSAFIDALGAEQLPLAYLLVALCTYPLLRIYQRLAARWSVTRLLWMSVQGAALSLMAFAFWFNAAPGSPWPSVAFYLWTSVVGILLVSQFWSLAGLQLDARQAKRLFAAVGAGGILGSVAGGQVARWGSELAGPFGALTLSALLLVLLVLGLGWFPRGRPGSTSAGPGPSDGRTPDLGAAGVPDPPPAVVSMLRGSPYLRWLSAGMLVAALVAQIVDLQFAWVVEQHTTDFRQRAAAFGNLYSIMGLAAFTFQLMLTGRIHRALGVGFALRVLPVANGLGALLFLAAAFFAPGLMWGAVWGLKIAENGLRYSLDQSTRELLFLPIAESRRAEAKVFVDVFVQRAAKGVAALFLVSVTFGWISVLQTAWAALLAVAIWLWIVGRTQRRYVASFRQGLLERSPDPAWAGVLDLRDVDTLEILVAGLGSSDPREVCHSLELLSAQGRGHLVPPWILAHDHGDVRLRALKIFRQAGPDGTGRRDAAPWVQRLLSDSAPAVRAAATRTLAAVAPQDLRRLMEERLLDRDPKVRSVAVAYLLDHEDRVLRARAEDSLLDMVADPSPEVRREAAAALAGLAGDRHSRQMIHLLYDGDLEVIRAAIQAVEQRCRKHGDGSPLFAPIVVSHLRRRKLKHEARAALVAYGEVIVPALQHFMFDSEEEIWVRRALPKTLAQIGGPRALKALVEALSTRDGLQRREVIEALVQLNAQGLRADRLVVESQIGNECRRYLSLLIDLRALESLAAAGRKCLMKRLLQDRLNRQVGNIFALLGLIYPPQEMRSSLRGLLRNRGDDRAHALEYLDNILVGELRLQVFAVIDDLPWEDRRRLARRLFGLKEARPRDVLRRWAQDCPADDVDGSWLAASALWLIHEEGLRDLYSLIEQGCGRSEDPIVHETAQLLARSVA